ncbi:YegP family protein [Serratia marcescens]
MGFYVIKKSEKQTPQPYYFVLHANNGQAIAISEMYATKQGAKDGIASVQLNAPTTDIRDETPGLFG